MRDGNYGDWATRPDSAPGGGCNRTAGLNPIQYESRASAGHCHQQAGQRPPPPRFDRSRRPAVAQRPAREAARPDLRARGKKGGVIACAIAHRANRLAFAPTRGQADSDAKRWVRED